MQGYNVIAVFDPQREKLLMCRRRKAPYQGLLNMVGGKIEPGEDGLSAAYRELREEASVTEADITLAHIMDFTYYHHDFYLEVYAGILKNHVNVTGDENELLWTDLNQDFNDTSRFAGDGNIGHILAQIQMSGI